MKLTALAPRPGPVNHPIRATLIDAINKFDAERDRSIQKRIGPSEVGEACARKLAYKMLEQPVTNPDLEHWAAIVGTACHAMAAQALIAQNIREGKLLWIVEHRVAMRAGLDGSTDAYYVPDALVVDHKFVGATKLKEYTKDGPSEMYRDQGHLYGLGWANLGVPVREVCIAFYPRTSHTLRATHVWSEPFDPERAYRAMRRMDDILAVAVDLKCDEYPENYLLIPKTPSDDCKYCDWFSPGNDTGESCAGHMEKK